MTSVIGGAETISTIASAAMITASARMLTAEPAHELVGDVGGARHRLDQRRRSPLGVEQVVGGEIAREQAFGGNRRRSDRRCPAAAIRPTTGTPRAARRRRRRRARAARPARADRSPASIAHSRDTTGAVRTCSGSTTSRSNPNTASAPAASISAASPATGTSSSHRQRSARRQPPDHRS